MKEKLTELLKTTKDKRFLYLSEDPNKLDVVAQYVTANVDFSAATTKVILMHTDGLVNLKFDLDGVYIDQGVLPIDFIRPLIMLREGGFIEEVSAPSSEDQI